MTEHELDDALRRAMVVKAASPSHGAAAERIAQRLASAPLPTQKCAFVWWPSALMDWSFAPAWPRVATLAGAAVLGISIGLSSLGTRIATDLDLVRAANADEGGNLFDLDFGLRP